MSLGQMSLFVAGAVLGQGVSLFVAGHFFLTDAVFGEGQISLFVTGIKLKKKIR